MPNRQRVLASRLGGHPLKDEGVSFRKDWNVQNGELMLHLTNKPDLANPFLASAVYTGLPLALFLSPTLGFPQPNHLVTITPKDVAPFSFNLSLSLFPLDEALVETEEHNLTLMVNVTVDGVVVDKDVSIATGHEVQLLGNQANVTISLLPDLMDKVKSGSDVEMVVKVGDWENEIQLVPMSKDHLSCTVKVSFQDDSSSSSFSSSSSSEEGPSINPPDKPTASVFPDDTPNLQLVPKQHSSLQEDLRVGFHFHSITQRDRDGNVVRELTFPKSGYSSSFPNNNTAEFGVKLGEHEDVAVKWRFVVVEEDTMFTFGNNKTFLVRGGFNKWNMTISGWPSSSSASSASSSAALCSVEEEHLALEVKVHVTSWDGPLRPHQQQNMSSSTLPSQTQANVTRTKFETERTELFVGLLQLSVVDGQERPAHATLRPISNEEGGGGQWLLIRLPMGERVEYDPDVQVLVDSTHDGDGGVNWKMVAAVAVSVGVAVMVVVGVIVGVVIWQRRKRHAFKASSGAVNFSGEDHTPLLGDYES
ncbi:hypothetical protein QOT17_021389 [Balamuthia mandrillaris]